MIMRKPVFTKYHFGFWAAILIGAFQLVNAVRAVADPVDFAGYMGQPLGDSSDTGFVLIYALRTGFIGAVVLYLCLRRNLEALSWLALMAVFLPLGDALLAFQAGAELQTTIRHLVIGAYLLATFFLLRRDTSHHMNSMA